MATTVSPEQQENAIKDFRKKAKDAVAGLAQDDLILWNVDMYSVFVDDATLSKSQTVIILKFLRAREFKVDDAVEMFISTLKWRAEFGTKKLMDEKFGDIYNELGIIYGNDKNGKPVTYNFYGSIAQDEILSDTATFLRWRIQLMEKAIALLDFENGLETITQVHDYTGASLFMDKRIKATSKEIIKIFQDHYPELLERKFFIGVPTLMEYLFSIFTALVSPATRAKFIVVSKSSQKAALIDHIPLTQLPKKYGGFEGSVAVEHEIKKEVVPARSSQILLDAVVKKGDKVKWQFSVVFGDIALTVGLEKDGKNVDVDAKVGGNGDRLEGGEGEYTATGDGQVSIKFDNSYSIINEKTVLYRIIVN
ncbi:hypothetical protein HK098_005769 [Nowakowskiella sp. JEL0407]|nr:hypothetical protein HK098_005769 [Nowakowskiella sp. JEL0407]